MKKEVHLNIYAINRLSSRYRMQINSISDKILRDVFINYIEFGDCNFILRDDYKIMRVIDNFIYQAEFGCDNIFSIGFYSILDCQKRIEKAIEKLRQIDSNKLNICVIGLGGVNSNILSILSHALSYLKQKPILNKLYIFENDIVEWHNIPRLPLDYYRIGMKKIEMANKFTNLAKETKTFSKYFGEKDLIKLQKDFVFIGAFDIETRKLFARHPEARALFIGNLRDNFYLFNEFKESDYELVHGETYGSLDLYRFAKQLLIVTPLTLKLIADILTENKAIDYKIDENCVI